ANDWRSRMSAEKNAFIVTPASSSVLVERPRCRALARRYTTATARMEPAKLARGAAGTPPADASVEPTSAPASVRGSLAMKKIWASGLSLNGTDQSHARRRLIGVDPINGAQRLGRGPPPPKVSTAVRIRPRMDLMPAVPRRRADVAPRAGSPRDARRARGRGTVRQP